MEAPEILREGSNLKRKSIRELDDISLYLHLWTCFLVLPRV